MSMNLPHRFNNIFLFFWVGKEEGKKEEREEEGKSGFKDRKGVKKGKEITPLST